jgi:hypothetical protein
MCVSFLIRGVPSPHPYITRSQIAQRLRLQHMWDVRLNDSWFTFTFMVSLRSFESRNVAGLGLHIVAFTVISCDHHSVPCPACPSRAGAFTLTLHFTPLVPHPSSFPYHLHLHISYVFIINEFMMIIRLIKLMSPFLVLRQISVGTHKSAWIKN